MLGGVGGRSSVVVGIVLAAALTSARAAHASTPQEEARQQFAAGAASVRSANWSEALAAFERSFALVRHPVTLFNIGACERALGSYTRARRTLLLVRELDKAAPQDRLPEAIRGDLEAFLAEIAGLLVVVPVHLEPASATITLDGRPLEITAEGPTPMLTAGLAAPGPGAAPPAGRFSLEVDPGVHVLVFARPGFQALTRLAGAIEVRASRAGAAVAVEGIDVGIAPLTVRRPGGRYHVEVRKAGFVGFVTDAVLEPGGRVELSAQLAPETTPLTKQWWFWTVAGGVVASAAVITYFATRPDPERPAANGGGLGWVLRTP